AILDHWFGTGGLGLDKNKIKYWSMDNEPDIWNGTHDDVMKTQPTAEAFMQLYFAVAKKARAKYPNIKLTGPVPASEWQWYSWNNSKITVGGKDYVWLEFFIKRIAEEQQASGIRLLDVIDIHSYPNETRDSDIVQLHRIYFDTTYVYPGANGVKTTSPSGWDNTITKEYVFGRCNKWLTQYMGPNHGVTFAVSEYGANNNSANVTAVSYSSILGTFADNSVELFTPWYWYPGMWETMHLYSRYAKTTRVQSVSSQDRYVSAYSSINTVGDSMTVILVNRSLTASKNTTVNLAGFGVTNGSYKTLSINQLPSTETFVSNTTNALKSSTVSVTGNSFTMSLPALSTTAVILKGQLITGINEIPDDVLKATLYPNPVEGENAFIGISNEKLSDLKVELFNMLGEVVYSRIYTGTAGPVIEIPCGIIKQGVYIINLSSANGKKWNSRFVKL
nr:T9SS type A sorting domain-containing protein [Bacteroidota bacterium]